MPETVLLDIATTDKTSLLLIPDDFVPTQSFTNIKQGVDESFIKFVDHLKMALEKQIESRGTRKY